LPALPAEFEEFYRKFFLPLVRRAAWKHGLSKEDARDVVQEAFILALEKLDPRRNPRAWLIQVVDHLSLNFQRKVVRRARLVSRWSSPESRVMTLYSETRESDDPEDMDGGDY
jgi:DNA-directed RNA polymerase specialized sigma24 family protein